MLLEGAEMTDPYRDLILLTRTPPAWKHRTAETGMRIGKSEESQKESRRRAGLDARRSSSWLSHERFGLVEGFL